MQFETSRVIRADHGSLAGHFPGVPIVPGVVILDEVLAAVEQWRGARVRIIRAVKFLQPLLPEQQFTIVADAFSKNEIAFRCLANDRIIVEGRLETGAE